MDDVAGRHHAQLLDQPPAVLTGDSEDHRSDGSRLDSGADGGLAGSSGHSPCNSPLTGAGDLGSGDIQGALDSACWDLFQGTYDPLPHSTDRGSLGSWLADGGTLVVSI